MEVLFLEAPYAGIVELCTETVHYLKQKKIKTAGLYASIQFVSKLQAVKQQLQELKITIITTKADRTHVTGQLLGCDNYHQSLNLSKEEWDTMDAFLYIGDGKFHPLALAFAQIQEEEFKEIICDDPIQKKRDVIQKDTIRTMVQRYKSYLIKFLSSKKVGVIITLKPGQEQFRPSLQLEKQFPDKKFFYFLDDTVSFNQLENFPFIDVWINTACPRIGMDDHEQFRKGVLNLTDALQADKILASLPSRR